MKKRLIIFLLLGIMLINCVYGFDYVFGTDIYERPILPKPAAHGGSVADPNTGVTITRISDAENDQTGTPIVCPAYTYADVENCDGSWVVLSSRAFFYYLYHGPNSSTPWAFERKIDPTVLGWTSTGAGASIEPRWDAEDPCSFYYVLGGAGSGWNSYLKPDYAGTLRRYNVCTNTETLIYDFKDKYPSAVSIHTAHEGDPSEDMRYWAFIIAGISAPGTGSVCIFDKDYYAKDEGEVIKEWINSTDLYGADNTRLSPSGEYVFIFHASPVWSKLYTVSDFPDTRWGATGSASHGTWAKLADGKDVLWFQDTTRDTYSYHDPTNKANVVQTVLDIDCTFGQGGCPGIHPSGGNYNKPGWGVVGTYGDAGSWSVKQIFMVELIPESENPRVWRLGHHQSTTSNINGAYWSQMAPPINRDGTRIYFASDWGDETGPIDTYVMQLPSTWYEDLSVPLETCTDLNGDCCSIGESCTGGAFQLSSDCGSLCCVGGICLDTTPPTRSSPKPTSDLSAGTVQTTISLATDEPATCRYSTSPGVSYPSMSDTFSTTGATAHSELITGLSDGSTYNFYVRCSDSSDNHNTDDFMISFGVDMPFQGDTCDGLELLLHFDEDSSTVTDYSGKGNDGAVNGAIYTSSGKFSGAFEYGGNGEFIESTPISQINGGSELTISAWIYIHDDGRDHWAVARGDSGSSSGTIILWADDACAIGVQGSGNTNTFAFNVGDTNTAGNRVNGGSGIRTLDTWHHVAGVMDGNQRLLYVDGELNAQHNSASQTTVGASADNFRIGDWQYVAQSFNGIIDEVAVWNRALSSEEIWELFDSGAPINCEESSCTSGADIDPTDNSVSITELIAFIEEWISGSVTIDNVLNAIGEWKDGC